MSVSIKKSENTSVTVCVRIRPVSSAERNAENDVVMKSVGDGCSCEEFDIRGEHAVKLHCYDHVFGDESTNEGIFELTGSKLADAALDGYNTVLFMYGQTSSGKTFTLFGNGPIPGLVHLTMDYVYKKVTTARTCEYVIRLQYAELYNEELKDLLSEKNEKLDIIDHPQLGPIIKNISEVEFSSSADIKKLLLEGEARRHFGVTNMNAHSSRSHVIVRLTIEGRRVATPSSNPLRKNWGRDKPTFVSTLNLVDLAGSERVEKSGTSGVALREGAAINRSLLTLGNVINALTEGKNTHINYRDSKLTRLLAAALGGNAKTLMITCISPASSNLSESQSTLKFATRAKKIVNVVMKNEVMDVKNLAELHKAEIEQLKSKLGNAMSAEEEQALRNKVVDASKSIRRMRFLMLHGSKFFKALNKVGQTQIAKKLQTDIYASLSGSGSKDLAEVISEISMLSHLHLPDDDKLVKILSLVDDEEELQEGDEEDEEKPEVTEKFEYTEEVDDVVQWGDLSEISEELECSRMYFEDKIGYAAEIISNLQVEIKNSRKAIESLDDEVCDLNQTVTKQKQMLESEKDKLEKERVESQKERDLFNQKFQDFELKVQAKDQELRDIKGVLLTRESEIERNKSQIENLTQELVAAGAMRQQVEEDFKKSRHDAKAQMDKLRSNMHGLLSNSSDTAKALETQVTQLQNDNDGLRDVIEILKQTKSRGEAENSHLRADLQKFKDESKSQIEEISVLRSQIVELTKNLQSQTLEITSGSARYNSKEKENTILREEMHQLVIKKDEEILEFSQKFKSQLQASQLENSNLSNEIEVLRTSKQTLVEEVSRMQENYYRLKDQLSNDINRLEKKIASQNKSYDDLKLDNADYVKSLHSVIDGLRVDNTKLKAALQEQERIVANINDFFESEKVTHDEDDSLSKSDSILDDSDTGSNRSSIRLVKPVRASSETSSSSILIPQRDKYEVEDVVGKYNRNSNFAIVDSVSDGLSHSPQFLGIKEGLLTILCSLSFCLSEDDIIREWYREEVRVLAKLLSETFTGVQHFKSHSDILIETNSNMKERMEVFAKNKERDHNASYLFEEKIRVKEKEYLDLLSKYDSAINICSLAEKEKNSLVVLLEKCKADNSILSNEVDDYKRRCTELSLSFEHCAEEMLAAQSEAAQYKQKFDIVQCERDELVKQYITEPHKRHVGLVNANKSDGKGKPDGQTSSPAGNPPQPPTPMSTRRSVLGYSPFAPAEFQSDTYSSPNRRYALDSILNDSTGVQGADSYQTKLNYRAVN